MTEEELLTRKTDRVNMLPNGFPAKIIQVDWSKNKRKNSKFIEIHPVGKAGLKKRWVKLADIEINKHFNN